MDRAPDVAAAVSELLDRQAITDLIHAYCYHFDRNEPVEVAALFTPDATVDYGPEAATIVGADAIASTISVGLERTFAATSHHVSNIQITLEGGDRARSVTYLYAWHRYVDGSPTASSGGATSIGSSAPTQGGGSPSSSCRLPEPSTSTARRCIRSGAADLTGSTRAEPTALGAVRGVRAASPS